MDQKQFNRRMKDIIDRELDCALTKEESVNLRKELYAEVLKGGQEALIDQWDLEIKVVQALNEQMKQEYIEILAMELLEIIDDNMTAKDGPHRNLYSYLTHAEVYRALDIVRKKLGHVDDPTKEQVDIIKGVRWAEWEAVRADLDGMVEKHMESLTDRDCLALWETEYKDKYEGRRNTNNH